MRTHPAFFKAAASLLLAAWGQAASATCYLVYAPDNLVVYRSLQSPVDLSLPLHLTMPAVAPRGRLVFSPDSQGCEFESNKLETLRTMLATPRLDRKRGQYRRPMRRARGA